MKPVSFMIALVAIAETPLAAADTFVSHSAEISLVLPDGAYVEVDAAWLGTASGSTQFYSYRSVDSCYVIFETQPRAPVDGLPARWWPVRTHGNDRYGYCRDLGQNGSLGIVAMSTALTHATLMPDLLPVIEAIDTAVLAGESYAPAPPRATDRLSLKQDDSGELIYLELPLGEFQQVGGDIVPTAGGARFGVLRVYFDADEDGYVPGCDAFFAMVKNDGGAVEDVSLASPWSQQREHDADGFSYCRDSSTADKIILAVDGTPRPEDLGTIMRALDTALSLPREAYEEPVYAATDYTPSEAYEESGSTEPTPEEDVGVPERGREPYQVYRAPMITARFVRVAPTLEGVEPGIGFALAAEKPAVRANEGGEPWLWTARAMVGYEPDAGVLADGRIAAGYELGDHGVSLVPLVGMGVDMFDQGDDAAPFHVATGAYAYLGAILRYAHGDRSVIEVQGATLQRAGKYDELEIAARATILRGSKRTLCGEVAWRRYMGETEMITTANMLTISVGVGL